MEDFADKITGPLRKFANSLSEGPGEGEVTSQVKKSLAESRAKNEALADSLNNSLDQKMKDFKGVIQAIQEETPEPFENQEEIVGSLKGFVSQMEKLRTAIDEGTNPAKVQKQFEAASEQASEAINKAVVAEDANQDTAELLINSIKEINADIDKDFKSLTDVSEEMQKNISQVGNEFQGLAGFLGAGELGAAVAGLADGFSKILGYVTRLGPLTVALGAPLLLAAGAATMFVGQMRDLREETGFSVERSRELANQTNNVAKEMQLLGINQEEAGQIQLSMIERYGTMENAAANLGKTQEQLVLDTGAFANRLGTSAEETAKLQGQIGDMANQMQGTADSAMITAIELSNAAGVAPQAVIQDIADNSERLAKFSANTTESIGRAAAEAANLGLSLENTLDFQEQTLDNISGQIQNLQTANFQVGGGINTSRLIEASMMSVEDAQATIKEELDGIDVENLNYFQKQSLDQAIPGFSIEEIQRMKETESILNEVGDSTRGLADAVSSGKLSVAEALAQTGDSQDPLQELQNQLSGLYVLIVQEIGPPVLDIIESIMPALQFGVMLVSETLSYLAYAIKGLADLLSGEFPGAAQAGVGALTGLTLALGVGYKAFTMLSSAADKFAGFLQRKLFGGGAVDKASKSMSKMGSSAKKSSKGFMSFKKAAGAAAVIIAIAGAVFLLSEAAQNFAAIEENFTQSLVGLAASMGILVVGLAGVAGIMATFGASFPLMAAGAIVIGTLAGSIYVLSQAAKVVSEALSGAVPFLDSFVGGIHTLSQIPTGRIATLAGELTVLSGALGAFAAGGILAGIGSFFGGGGVIESLGNLDGSEVVVVKQRTEDEKAEQRKTSQLLQQILKQQQMLNQFFKEEGVNVYMDQREVSKSLTSNQSLVSSG